MAKYDRLALRAKLELRLQAVYDDAAEHTAMNESSFEEWRDRQVEYNRKQIRQYEEAIGKLKALEFGVRTEGFLNAPGPVEPNAGSIRALQQALDELDILVGDEITLKSTAMLKLL